jgi:HEAT repeat protein
LGRLDPLPGEAVALLIDCASDASDGLRMNAAMALKAAPAGAVGGVMRHLLQDPNLRIRLIAASAILGEEPDNAQAAAVVADALQDPSAWLRKAALALVESLGARGACFQQVVQECLEREDEPEVRARLAELIARFISPSTAEPAAGAGRVNDGSPAVAAPDQTTATPPL